VPLSLRAENQFRLDIDELESKISDRTKLVIINSPQNPTGGMLTPDDIDRVAALLAERSVYVLSDEIYGRIVYGETEQTSIVSRPGMAEKTIILDGFSKTYAMTGWRLGYGVMNTELADAIAQLQTNSTSCTAAFVQMAGIAALTGPQNEVDVFVNEFRHRRNVLVDGLNSIEGVDCQKPAGAFYVFPQLQGFRFSADEIATRLLDDAGVAVLSGTAFGAVGSDSLRLSFANSVENLKQAIDRIKELLDQLR
jgi:aspartate/methionine/tyrosine aminotransferase